MSLPSDVPFRYAIAVGSNRRGRYGRPSSTAAAALKAIGGVVALSPVLTTRPIGPSIRQFVNQVAIIASVESPPALLRRIKQVERAFGRRRGQRWGARVVDLDIILWSRGAWVSAGLVVPHAAFRDRRFVLQPLKTVAGQWRDPVTGLTIRQLERRLIKPVPILRG